MLIVCFTLATPFVFLPCKKLIGNALPNLSQSGSWPSFQRDTYFRNKSLGVSLVNFGTSFGFTSCWVLEGLEV